MINNKSNYTLRKTWGPWKLKAGGEIYRKKPLKISKMWIGKSNGRIECWVYPSKVCWVEPIELPIISFSRSRSIILNVRGCVRDSH